MMYLALKEVGSVEAQMLPWQQTSYFFIEFSKKHLCL